MRGAFSPGTLVSFRSSFSEKSILLSGGKCIFCLSVESLALDITPSFILLVCQVSQSVLRSVLEVQSIIDNKYFLGI